MKRTLSLLKEIPVGRVGACGFMLLATMVMVFGNVDQAKAITIDFEDLLVPVGTQLNPDPGLGVTSRGFNYTPGPNNASGFNDLHITNQQTFLPFNGSTIGLTHDDVVLTQVGGGVFDLISFDFAGFPTNREIPFGLTGAFFGGGTITANFTPDALVDGVGGVDDFQTFLLGPGWTNLASVTWDHSGPGTVVGSFGLDNIVTDGVAPIPEPGTLLLIGSGLVGIGVGARRRRRK